MNCAVGQWVYMSQGLSSHVLLHNIIATFEYICGKSVRTLPSALPST